jgi:hypothetical protein
MAPQIAHLLLCCAPTARVLDRIAGVVVHVGEEALFLKIARGFRGGPQFFATVPRGAVFPRTRLCVVRTSKTSPSKKGHRNSNSRLSARWCSSVVGKHS